MTELAAISRDLRKGWRLPADQAPIVSSEHAVSRFGERTGRDLPLPEVERQLRRMLRASVIAFEPTDWYADPVRAAWGYLLICDHFMPLHRHGTS